MVHYSVRCRIQGATIWTTEDEAHHVSLEMAERMAADLRRREPTNDEGETLEYSVVEA